MNSRVYRRTWVGAGAATRTGSGRSDCGRGNAVRAIRYRDRLRQCASGAARSNGAVIRHGDGAGLRQTGSE